MSEMIATYDANRNPIGASERVDAHVHGLWHVTFHLWILLTAPPAGVLYQLRSPTTKNFPNLLDISAAGHLVIGETPLDGIREAKEELGIDIDVGQLQLLGWRVEVADQENGQINREHQAVHLLKLGCDLEEFRPNPQEVYGLVKVPVEPGLRLHAGLVESVNCDAVWYSNGTWTRSQRPVRQIDFLPRLQPYYQTVHIMCERALAAKNAILAI